MAVIEGEGEKEGEPVELKLPGGIPRKPPPPPPPPPGLQLDDSEAVKDGVDVGQGLTLPEGKSEEEKEGEPVDDTERV